MSLLLLGIILDKTYLTSHFIIFLCFICGLDWFGKVDIYILKNYNNNNFHYWFV